MSATVLSAATAPASAAVVASSFHIGNVIFAVPAQLMPINGAGPVLPFVLPAPTRVVITFSAECAVNAPAGNTTAWLDIDLRVNGVPIAPTAGNLDAFCSANGTAGIDGWVRPSVTVAAILPAGVHQLSVVARRNNGATGGSLGDMSTVIER